MTKAEVLLWLQINSFILDFYCPKHHLAIEVDGLTHSTEDEIEYDKIRQCKIKKYGIDFIRFTNSEIYGNMNYVLDTIKNKIEYL